MSDTKCQIASCANRAAGALALNVPVPGSQPVRLVLGVQLCARCIATVKAQEYFQKNADMQTTVRVQALGRAEPDFTRAFASLHPFNSAEWEKLQKRVKPIDVKSVVSGP
jgi:hypothetical protein